MTPSYSPRSRDSGAVALPGATPCPVKPSSRVHSGAHPRPSPLHPLYYAPSPPPRSLLSSVGWERGGQRPVLRNEVQAWAKGRDLSG